MRRRRPPWPVIALLVLLVALMVLQVVLREVLILVPLVTLGWAALAVRWLTGRSDQRVLLSVLVILTAGTLVLAIVY